MFYCAVSDYVIAFRSIPEGNIVASKLSEKSIAQAVELAKAAVASDDGRLVEQADSVAKFIGTVAEKLEELRNGTRKVAKTKNGTKTNESVAAQPSKPPQTAQSPRPPRVGDWS